MEVTLTSVYVMNGDRVIARGMFDLSIPDDIVAKEKLVAPFANDPMFSVVEVEEQYQVTVPEKVIPGVYLG